MAVRLTKRAKSNLELVPTSPVDPADAIAALKKFKGTKFDQTVNICMHLGLDQTLADQNLRGAMSLPRGIGKTKRVIAFCPSDVAPQAIAAGAIKAGGEDLVAEIEKGFMDFDVAIASPDMMRVVSKLGKLLGPKGLMPSPKAGTVATNVILAVKEYSAGKVEYRLDKGGNVHGVIGKLSFANDALKENLEFFVSAIEKARPPSAKGVYIKRITISGAMTPGVQIKHVQAEVAVR